MIYLDSLDSYYSIDHNEPEPKEKPSKKNNDRTIGIISLIGIIAYIAVLISGWVI